MLLCLHTYTFDYYYNGKVHYNTKESLKYSYRFQVVFVSNNYLLHGVGNLKICLTFPRKCKFTNSHLVLLSEMRLFCNFCTVCSIIYHFELSNQRATIFCLFLHNSRLVLTLDHFRGILDTVQFVFLASLWLWLVWFTYFVKIRRRELCSKKTARWLVVFLFLP